MEAGPELDALIDERVYRFKWHLSPYVVVNGTRYTIGGRHGNKRVGSELFQNAPGVVWEHVSSHLPSQAGVLFGFATEYVLPNFDSAIGGADAYPGAHGGIDGAHNRANFAALDDTALQIDQQILESTAVRPAGIPE